MQIGNNCGTATKISAAKKTFRIQGAENKNPYGEPIELSHWAIQQLFSEQYLLNNNNGQKNNQK